jgi:hypothetical protein
VLSLLVAGVAWAGARRADPVVLIAQGARDSMTAAFARFNAHWDEQADLNQMERMLGTVRPIAREYLGCLQGERRGDTVFVQQWTQARHLRQLPLAVTGDCDSIPRLLGTWHTHPFRPDSLNRAIKERSLSKQDLRTLDEARDYALALVMWDADSIDAAIRGLDGRVIHPAVVHVGAEAP